MHAFSGAGSALISLVPAAHAACYQPPVRARRRPCSSGSSLAARSERAAGELLGPRDLGITTQVLLMEPAA